MIIDRRLGIGLLVALAGPILFYGLGSYSLVNGDEGIYHYMARRMVETGDWFRLEFTGEHRVYDTLTHAPLFLWTKALIILAIGDSYWSMRILTAALGLFSVLAIYQLVDYLENQRAAFFAGVFQLCTFQFVYLHSARTGEMETALTLAFTLAAWLFLRALSSGGSFVAHHVCLVALMNLKLAIVIVPVLAEVAYFALHPSARGRLRDWILTATWMLPLGLAWHMVQLYEHWEELPAVLRSLQEQSLGGAIFDHRDLGLPGRFAYYARQLLYGAFPFTMLYPVALVGVLAMTPRGPARWAWTLPALYAGSVALFFLSLSIHRPWYLVPMTPFLSAFLGAGFARAVSKTPSRLARIAIAAALGVTVWIEPPVFNVSPFIVRAMNAPSITGWASWFGLAPWLGVSATAFGIWLALEVASLRWRPAATFVPIGLALFIVAGMRVLAPLQYVDHVSGMERIARSLEDDRRAGRSVDYPVIVHSRGHNRARYYFGDQFDIRRRPRRDRRVGEVYALYPIRTSHGDRPSRQAPNDRYQPRVRDR